MRVISANYGNVDLGSLNWSVVNTHCFYTWAIQDIKSNVSSISVPNITCTKYKTISASQSYNGSVGNGVSIGVSGIIGDKRIVVYDSSFTDATSFKNSLNGIILTYEVATPKTTQPYGYLTTHKARVITDKYGNVDLGSLQLRSNSGTYPTNFFYSLTRISDSKPNTTNIIVNAPIQSISINGDKQIVVRFSKNFNSFQDAMNEMSGVILTYELATPRTQAPYGYIQVNKGKVKVSNVCQLANKEIYYSTRTINGITFTNNNDGTITCNGTPTAISSFKLDNLQTDYQIIGHKYLLIGCPQGGSRQGYYLDCCSGADTGNGAIGVCTSRYSLQIYVAVGGVCNNVTFKPQLFDLTEMYGAGNEPTSVAQFKQDFPLDYYDYAPKCYIQFK